MELRLLYSAQKEVCVLDAKESPRSALFGAGIKMTVIEGEHGNFTVNRGLADNAETESY
jgi:hypothetical protein